MPCGSVFRRERRLVHRIEHQEKPGDLENDKACSSGKHPRILQLRGDIRHGVATPTRSTPSPHPSGGLPELWLAPPVRVLFVRPLR